MVCESRWCFSLEISRGASLLAVIVPAVLSSLSPLWPKGNFLVGATERNFDLKNHELVITEETRQAVQRSRIFPFPPVSQQLLYWVKDSEAPRRPANSRRICEAVASICVVYRSCDVCVHCCG